VLQILVALNRVPEAAEPLRTEIALADARSGRRDQRHPAPVRARHRQEAGRAVVEQALAEPAADPATGAAAWTTIGRCAWPPATTPAPSKPPAAAQAQPALRRPAMLALELMDPKQPQAEAIVRTYLQGQPMPELRMGYARALLDAQRYPEAQQQLQIVTAEKPELAEAWLAQGALQAQDNQLPAAEPR
jgi:hypothetical protein